MRICCPISQRTSPPCIPISISDNGSIVACSREAKRLGVRTGLRVRDARKLAPGIALVPDCPSYYRAVHVTLVEILESTPCRVEVRGIDEMYLEEVNVD